MIAFDTGPGNMVIDALVSHVTGGKQRFDRDGRGARAGTVREDLLMRLMKNSYFSRKPPKTSGREQFGHEFVNELFASGLPLPDLIATATELTARSIAGAIRGRQEVIVSGGGVHNGWLMQRLKASLPESP